MESEIYKDVLGFEGLYKVSNFGNVLILRTNRLMKPDVDNRGYYIYGLSINGKQKKIKAHRLVYFTFNECADKSLQINHLDRVKTNNKLSNLELVNTRENSTHREIGKAKSSKYTGVSWGKRENKWRATIMINKHQKYLGVYTCEAAAHLAYLKALKQLNVTNKYA